MAKYELQLMVRRPRAEVTSLRPRWLVARDTGLASMLSILRRMAKYQELPDAGCSSA